MAPGAFPTAATEIHADQEGLWRDVLEAQSIKRRGEVEDVARAIAFFAGDDSRFVTGQTLLVDGGLNLKWTHLGADNTSLFLKDETFREEISRP